MHSITPEIPDVLVDVEFVYRLCRELYFVGSLPDDILRSTVSMQFQQREDISAKEVAHFILEFCL